MANTPSSVHRRYSFGPYSLDPMRRLLWRDGTLVPLTPKTVEVLSVLVEHHGEVVGKDDLLRFVWPNTVVEENNLARHISILRKALQQRRGQHDFISTVPGRGYMFVATVVELEDLPPTTAVKDGEPALPGRVSEVPSPTALEAVAVVPMPAVRNGESDAFDQASWHTRWNPATTFAVSAALILGLGAGSLLYLVRRTDTRAVRGELRQLTFDPGIQRDPTWSPDGGWLAYSADRAGNLDLYRRSVGDPTPVQLTSDPADESQPDWSPDGQWIAFRSEKDGGGIYVMPSAGGAAQRVTASGFFPRWSPDSSRLLIRGSMLRGIGSSAFILKRDGTDLVPVRPDLLRQFKGPHVAWYPDGERVSIAGRQSSSGWSFITAAIDGKTFVASPSASAFGEDLRNRNVTLGRFVWAKSARYLYFEGRAGDTQNIWRVEVEPRSLAWKSPPERISTGTAEYTDLAISTDAARLAFTVRHDRTRVWSFPFAPESGAIGGAGQPVTPGGPAEYDAAAPLDGSKVAYRTIRGGRQELWQRSTSGEGERLLASSAGAVRTSPRWSRDGMRLAYMRRNGDGSAATGARVAIMPVGGGPEELLDLPPDTEVVPDDWSSDGLWILGACRRAARQPMGTCLIPSSGNAARDLRVVAADPSRSLLCQRFSPDERWISFMAVDDARRDVSTIYIMPAAGGRWIAVTDGNSYDDKPRWSPDGKVLYFLSARDGAINLWGRRFDPELGTAVGGPFRVTSFHGTGPAVARDLGRVEIAISSSRLFLPITESAGTIWMLEGLDR